jgi:4-hydroxy-3-methylbut-2-enyl diphosphate reductase
MDVIIGKSSGFCSGVQRAIKGATNALKEHKKIYCFGEIIHNPVVVKTLKDMGMVVVNDIEKVPDKSWFVIRSHGLQNEIYKRAVTKKLEIFDFTCPKVKKIHSLVTELTDEGCDILIVGNPYHPEVKAILSLASGNAKVIEKPGELKTLDSSKHYAVVVQTTFNPEAFLRIVNQIILCTKKTIIYNTLCEETIKRQTESLQLANEVDFIVVVGGKNSSNTKTLYNTVKKRVSAVHIEDINELDMRLFKDIERVGIISGASAPEEEVKKVYEYLTGSVR